VQLQEENGTDMGSILHYRHYCTEMVKVIARDKRQKLYSTLVQADSKFALTIDESTALSKKSALIVYLRFAIEGEINSVFIHLIELDAQDSETITKSIVALLTHKCNMSSDFIRQHFVAFCSDGASVMTGKNSGMGTLLKRKFPYLVW
jgi:hypothetical protein